MTAIAKYGPPLVTALPLLYQGKTRDTHVAQWPNQSDKRRPPLLIVATDRLSTHNVVHESTIPKKGEVLTALTILWLTEVLGPVGVFHHLIAYGKRIYDYLPGERADYPKDLHHRAIVVRQLDIIPVEFIFRAYLAGSLWDKFYSKDLDNPYGIALPKGLPLMYKFGEFLFTPTEKSETDDPLNGSEVRRQHKVPVFMGMIVMLQGSKVLNKAGLELVDAKFEFGLDEDGRVLLADEMLTPDSSRFARLADIREGENPPWLDKQLARDKAEAMWAGGPKVPLTFSPLTIAKLSHAYVDLFGMVTGVSLDQFQRERLD